MALKIQSNSRQIPKTKDICSNKKYYDILYAYLQYISHFDEVNKVRYFYKKEINFTKLGQQFNLSRQTISTKFKNLKELGLIIERDKDTYEVTILEKDLAALIPYDTLKLITDTLNENSISTYIYLLNNWIRVGNKSYQFTLEQIKNHIGICATTRSNDNIVTNILFVLQKIGLIKYSLTTIQQENDVFENIKTVHQIDWLTNKIEQSK